MKFPKVPTEYYLRVSLAHHQLMEKYDFYRLTDPRKHGGCYKCGLYANLYNFRRLVETAFPLSQ